MDNCGPGPSLCFLPWGFSWGRTWGVTVADCFRSLCPPEICFLCVLGCVEGV